MSKFEENTNQLGWGLYNQFVIGVASACTFSQALAFMSIPFALPIAACDLSLNRNIVMCINFSLYLGMAIGGLVLNCMCDTVGRKCMIPTSLLLMFGSNFACGFSHGYGMIMICVFVLGAGIATNIGSVKIHLGETLPMKKRGYRMIIPDLLWTIGYMMSILFSWFVTPMMLHTNTTDVRLATWRLIFGLAAGPSIMVACASALLYPSPRFLLYNRQYPEALESMKQIYTINNNKHFETFQFNESELQNLINNYGINTEPPAQNCNEQSLMVFRRIRKTTALILSRRFFFTTLILTTLKMPTIFGIVVLNTWLTKMLHYGEGEECFLTGLDLVAFETYKGDDFCKLGVDSEAHRDSFVLAISILAGQIILMCIVEKMGRRIPIMCGCMICGVLSLLLAYIRSFYIIRLAMSVIFMASYSMVQSAISIALVELYPTAVRGTAAGETQVFAYIFSALVYNYLQTPCQYSFIVVGTCIMAATVPAYFLPDVTGKPMVE